MSDRVNTAVYFIFVITMLASLVLSMLLSFRNTGYLAIAILLITLLVCGHLAQNRSAIMKIRSNIFLILIVLNILVIAPELFFRVIDFHYESGIQADKNVEFAGLRPEHYLHYVPDDNLFWKLPSSNPQVNSLGFPGDNIIIPKPPKTYRILYLGDSVTQLGYAQYVETYLNKYLAGDSLIFDCVTLAVSGYSSYQGAILADMYADKFEADLVFVFFGWNDHWLAYRGRDIQFHNAKYPDLLWHIYHHSKILQFANKFVHSFSKPSEKGLVKEVRVLPDEYRQNLIQINSIFQKQDIPVVLITAPTTHYRLGVPDFLVEKKLGVSKDSIINLHRHYNQLERELANINCIPLLDLELEYDTLSNLSELFIDDGIHFTRLGTEYTAQRIFDFIKDNYFN